MITKRSLRKCLNYVIDCFEREVMLAGDKLDAYCAKPKHKRAIEVLEGMGALECIYYDDREKLIAVYPSREAALAECKLGVGIRERWVSFGLGLVSGAALSIFTAWVTGTLRF